jgi:hypothetical protein
MQNGRKQDFHPGIVDLAARQRPGSMTKKARPILGLSPSSTDNELASKPIRAPGERRDQVRRDAGRPRRSDWCRTTPACRPPRPAWPRASCPAQGRPSRRRRPAQCVALSRRSDGCWCAGKSHAVVGRAVVCSTARRKPISSSIEVRSVSIHSFWTSAAASVPGKPCRPPMPSSEPGRMLELAPFQGSSSECRIKLTRPAMPAVASLAPSTRNSRFLARLPRALAAALN